MSKQTDGKPENATPAVLAQFILDELEVLEPSDKELQ